VLPHAAAHAPAEIRGDGKTEQRKIQMNRVPNNEKPRRAESTTGVGKIEMIVSTSPGSTGNQHIARADSQRNPFSIAIAFIATFIAVYGIETGALALLGGVR
jgi:hypothetical protein